MSYTQLTNRAIEAILNKDITAFETLVNEAGKPIVAEQGAPAENPAAKSAERVGATLEVIPPMSPAHTEQVPELQAQEAEIQRVKALAIAKQTFLQQSMLGMSPLTLAVLNGSIDITVEIFTILGFEQAYENLSLIVRNSPNTANAQNIVTQCLNTMDEKSQQDLFTTLIILPTAETDEAAILILEQLLEFKTLQVNGEDGQIQALHEVTRAGCLLRVKALLQRDDIVVDCYDQEQYTPLQYACKLGYTKIVNCLLAKDAQIYPTTEQTSNNNDASESPLTHATKNHHPNVVSALLRAGAQPDKQDDDASVPLHLAAEVGDLAIFMLFTSDAAINIDMLDGYGKTPLYYAISNGQKNIVEFLIIKGAKLEMCFEDEGSYLHIAARCGQIDILKLLLQKIDDIEPDDSKDLGDILQVELVPELEHDIISSMRSFLEKINQEVLDFKSFLANYDDLPGSHTAAINKSEIQPNITVPEELNVDHFIEWLLSPSRILRPVHFATCFSKWEFQIQELAIKRQHQEQRGDSTKLVRSVESHAESIKRRLSMRIKYILERLQENVKDICKNDTSSDLQRLVALFSTFQKSLRSDIPGQLSDVNVAADANPIPLKAMQAMIESESFSQLKELFTTHQYFSQHSQKALPVFLLLSYHVQIIGGMLGNAVGSADPQARIARYLKTTNGNDINDFDVFACILDYVRQAHIMIGDLSTALSLPESSDASSPSPSDETVQRTEIFDLLSALKFWREIMLQTHVAYTQQEAFLYTVLAQSVNEKKWDTAGQGIKGKKCPTGIENIRKIIQQPHQPGQLTEKLKAIKTILDEKAKKRDDSETTQFYKRAAQAFATILPAAYWHNAQQELQQRHQPTQSRVTHETMATDAQRQRLLAAQEADQRRRIKILEEQLPELRAQAAEVERIVDEAERSPIGDIIGNQVEEAQAPHLETRAGTMQAQPAAVDAQTPPSKQGQGIHQLSEREQLLGTGRKTAERTSSGQSPQGNSGTRRASPSVSPVPGQLSHGSHPVYTASSAHGSQCSKAYQDLQSRLTVLDNGITQLQNEAEKTDLQIELRKLKQQLAKTDKQATEQQLQVLSSLVETFENSVTRINQMKSAATRQSVLKSLKTTFADIGQALDERGKKLRQLEEQAERLSNAGKSFADSAHALKKQMKG